MKLNIAIFLILLAAPLFASGPLNCSNPCLIRIHLWLPHNLLRLVRIDLHFSQFVGDTSERIQPQ